MLDLMFLQSGLGYRFRYKREYVFPSLQDPNKLIDRKGYIVHAHTKKNELKEKDDILEFLPIREVTIREVKDLGAFVWIYFELGDWITFSRDDQTPNEHHTLLRSSTPAQSQDMLTLTLYESQNLVLDTTKDDPSGQRVEVIQNWVRIIKQMARFQPHKEKKPTYLKLMSVQAANCENAIEPVTFSKTERGYELRSDTDHKIQVFQYNPTGVPKEPFPLTLFVDEERIVPLVKDSTIWGEYDLLLMSLRPSATLRDYRTLLRFEPKLGEDMKLTVTIPVKVLKGFRLLVGPLSVAAAIALGSLMGVTKDASIQVALILIAFSVALIGTYWGSK